MADVALVRLKAGGKFYEVGDEVPKQDDSADLRERGLLGSSADAKKILDAQENAETKAAELEAKAEELRAQADQARNEATAVSTPTESVTDQEAQNK